MICTDIDTGVCQTIFGYIPVTIRVWSDMQYIEIYSTIQNICSWFFIKICRFSPKKFHWRYSSSMQVGVSRVSLRFGVPWPCPINDSSFIFFHTPPYIPPIRATSLFYIRGEDSCCFYYLKNPYDVPIRFSLVLNGTARLDRSNSWMNTTWQCSIPRN